MKKINQFIHLLFLSVALFSSALLAQQAPPVTDQGVDLGTSNKYKIGTSDNPVYATEYVGFLNDKAPSDSPWIESTYYDGSFMNASNNWSFQNNPKAAIYRTGTSGKYSYSVISGHENDIIDAVYYQSIQQEFASWRAANEAAAAAAAAALTKNPTRQELCDYINDKIAGHLDPSYLDKATEIQNRYPNAAGLTVADIENYNSTSISYFFISAPSDCVEQTLWQQVDELVTHIYGHDVTDSTLRVDKHGQAYTTVTHYAASDDACNNFVQRWGMVFSNEVDASLNFPSGMPKVVGLLDRANPDEQQRWAEEYPANYKKDTLGITLPEDAVVVTKIPYNPPAPNNGDTPTPPSQN